MLGGLSIEHVADHSAQALSLASNGATGVRLNGASVQRRPLALLAFLAAGGERGQLRDEVLLHLWPDSTPQRARNVLKQTLYALRRDLHAPDVVFVRGNRLHLNPAVVTSDLAELEAALDGGEIDRALALHRGEFLDGFTLAEVPEFEQWARKERERVATRIEAARRPRDPSDHELAIEMPSVLARRDSAKAPWRPRRWVVAAVALTSLVAVQMARRAPGSATMREAVDSKVMVVLPFDVANTDTALTFLAKGMVDLLAVRLTGDRDGGIRAVSPRVVLGTWERAQETESTPAALRLAERLGAGRVVRGAVVGTRDRLVFTAEMLVVPRGTVLARASAVGMADSLAALVDRLAATLLLGADATDAGAEPAAHLAIATTPLAAIRDYVDGQAAYRAGHYDEAVQRFERALARDSMFALAAFGLASSAGWTGAGEPTIRRGARLAWRYQDRLPHRAKLMLLASAGGAEALRSGYAPSGAVTSAAEQAAEANADDPDSWYGLGDRYLHLGAAIGLAAPLDRASAAFRRAIALDETFAPPFIHLVQLAARSGDTSAVRRLATQLLRHDSTSEAAEFIRWRSAVSLGDSAELLRLRTRFDAMHPGALRLILTTAQCDAVGLGDADSALAAMLRHSATAGERANALIYAHAYALDRGRWADALRATEGLRDADPVPRWHLRIRVLDALYAGGDTSAARAAVDTLRSFADAPLSSDLHERSAQYEDDAVVAQWRLWHGDRRGLSRALARLTGGASPPDSLRRVVANRIAAALLRAIAANTGGSRDPASVETLDALLAANVLAPFEWPGLYPALVAARLFASNSQPQRALTAVRRRTNYFPESTYLAASLELEAQLTAQLGDTATAAVIRRQLDALRGPQRDHAAAAPSGIPARGQHGIGK
jgi:Tfp pilus assembly protein PilF